MESVLFLGGVTTLAGCGESGYNDGHGKDAFFKSPYGLAVDNARGWLYIADYGNHRIRSVWRLCSCGILRTCDRDVLLPDESLCTRLLKFQSRRNDLLRCLGLECISGLC